MTTLRSVIRRNAIRIVVILTVLLLVAFKVQKVDISYTSHPTKVYSDSNITSRLHYLVPATLAKPPVCAVVASALVNRYPIPTILGYKGEGEYDAKKAHIAKLRAIKRYLYSPAGAEEDDLVIIVDGFDVLAQIPAETVIERYFDLIAEADQKLADQHGITVEEAHSRGLRQTLLWGTDKGCFPTGGKDPRCWLVPFSNLPRYKWGPKTDNGELVFSDSRFLNSGTVIGPLGDLRRFIDAALQLIKDTWDPDFKFHNSDQYYISTLYARQEYQRTLDLNNGQFPGDIGGRNLPRKKEDENDVTEYHVLVDFGYSITQTQCHNDRFMRKLQYKNHDLTATVAEDAFEEGESFRPYNIQMPSSLYQALSRFYDSLLGDERPSMSAKEWVRSLRLGTNIGTGNIYAFYHNTCSKKAFVDKYHDSWFFPLMKPLLRAAVRAIQEKQPLHPRLINGRIWMAVNQYPDNSDLQDELGGVFTDFEGETFIPLQAFCKEHLAAVIGIESE